MVEAQAALRLAPRDLEIHHTVGAIYERMHKYEEAAAAYTNYVNLLPNKDTSDKADWSRAEIRFLRSFGERVPFEAEPGSDDKLFTIPFQLVNDKVVVRAKVNGAREQDFVVDTGSEQHRHHASDRAAPRRRCRSPTRSAPASATSGCAACSSRASTRSSSATLKLRNVPCLIKNPPLRSRPADARDRKPVAAGARLLDDHRLQDAGRSPSASTCPWSRRISSCRCGCTGLRRCGARSTARATRTSSSTPAARSSRSARRRANALGQARGGPEDPAEGVRHARAGIATRSCCRASIWRSTTIQYRNFPVVVLNLDTPSALLGFQLGGIVGHKFLSNYRVGIDLERSVLRLKKAA